MPASHKELLFLQEQGVPVKKRAEVLGKRLQGAPAAPPFDSVQYRLKLLGYLEKMLDQAEQRGHFCSDEAFAAAQSDLQSRRAEIEMAAGIGCPDPWNPDSDGDGVGDHCDEDDGWILVVFTDARRVEWQQEAGFDTWNCYRGDLDALRASGVYTQERGSNDLAERWCQQSQTWVVDSGPEQSGEVAFYLVTGNAGGEESSLGENSEGQPRPNAGACPQARSGRSRQSRSRGRSWQSDSPG